MRTALMAAARREGRILEVLRLRSRFRPSLGMTDEGRAGRARLARRRRGVGEGRVSDFLKIGHPERRRVGGSLQS